MNDGQTLLRMETWLLQDNKMRRPTSRDVLSVGAFLEQQTTGVDYAVFKWIKGTHSDELGDTSPWQKVKPNALGSGKTAKYARM
jgi:hypothetical protein